MKGARGVLINITGGLDMTLFEVDEAANRIRERGRSRGQHHLRLDLRPDPRGQDPHLRRRHRHRRHRLAAAAPGLAQPGDRNRPFGAGAGRRAPRARHGRLGPGGRHGDPVARRRAPMRWRPSPSPWRRPAYAPATAPGGRSPDDAAGHGGAPAGDGSAGHDRPAGPRHGRAAADGPGGEALRGPRAGATDAARRRSRKWPPRWRRNPCRPRRQPRRPGKCPIFSAG